MDEVVKRSINLVESKKRNEVPWQFDEPWHQAYYVYSFEEQKWQTCFESVSTIEATSTPIKNLALYSWNIDFMLPFPNSRMSAAVRHLQSLVKKIDQDTGVVIYLQESVGSDLELLATDPWIRETFATTDLNKDNWQSGHYGTVTLVDKRLPIASCFRVHYSETRMERDAFFVEVLLQGEVIRLCNSHLESLAFEPPRRPPQVRMIAGYMHDQAVHGAVAAGDFNAIQDFDRTLHKDNNLKDAYLELGGDEYDAENGHTWGQQAATTQRERFGTTRMDKVFFCGGLKCTHFERFGAGVELSDETERRAIVGLGFDRPWITDHLGVMAKFEVVDPQVLAGKIIDSIHHQAS